MKIALLKLVYCKKYPAFLVSVVTHKPFFHCDEICLKGETFQINFHLVLISSL